MVLRSDELANEAEVERDTRFRGNVGKGIATATTLGAGAFSGALGSKIMPFLNQYIPSGLAMKGIEKISPRLGAFLKKGQQMGLDVEEGLNFIKEKVGKEPAKENRNIIEQYSPELHKFIADKISGGNSPIQAAAIAQNDKKYADVIKKLTKDHKTSWSSIIDSIYGTGQYGGAVNPPHAQQQQAQQQPTQQQQGGIDPQLAQILQQGSQLLQKFRGQ